MKVLESDTNRFTEVIVLDEKGEGNACHEYEVRRVHEETEPLVKDDYFAKISFQNGPIKENGVNGCHQEDLLAIVIHRLECFQSGPFACRENRLALACCESALDMLSNRTKDRQDRGVEGTNQE